MNRTARICGAAASLVALAAPATAAAQRPSLSLAPSTFSGTVRDARLEVGPLRLTNGSSRAYRVEVVPVLLTQQGDGTIHVDNSPPALRAARELIRPSRRQFMLRSGRSRSIRGIVDTGSVRDGLAGGLTFRATPSRQGSGLTNVLELTGSIYLRAPRTPVRLAPESVHAEQAGRKLKLTVPVRNLGRSFTTVRGRVVVNDAGGRPVARAKLQGTTVLPGAMVDLSALTGRRLPPGNYTLTADLSSGRRSFRAVGNMELFGVSEVRTERAKLTRLAEVQAYPDEPVSLDASFQNTGNVTWAPRAEYEVREPGGEVVSRGTLTARPVDPGKVGTIRGKASVPAGAKDLEVQVRILSAGRVLDSRSDSVRIVPKPPISQRVAEHLAQRATLYVAFLLTALLAMGAAMARILLRR